VPSVRPVRSRVVPDGTGMALRTIVAQLVFDLLTCDAAVKVQVVARLPRAAFSRLGAAVGLGIGDAVTNTALLRRRAIALEY